MKRWIRWNKISEAGGQDIETVVEEFVGKRSGGLARVSTACRPLIC